MTRARDVANVLTAASVLATDTETAAAISSHAAAADPHTAYLKESEFNAAGKNYLINGAFDIWQRGTSGTFTNGVGYVPDRWFGIVSGGAPTCTISRQTADTTNLSYGARFGRNSGQTGVGTVYFVQTLESVISKSLAGQTVTISFYAKKGSDAPNPLYVGFYFGTGTDQSSNTLFNGGGWTNTTQSNTGVTITNTMTRYTVTVNVSSSINQAMLYFAYTSSGTAGANEWIQIEGVQLEIGSVATPFSRAGGTLQGELAACQRYYWRMTSTVSGTPIGFGSATGNADNWIQVPNPVPMRVRPTSADYSNLTVSDGYAYTNAVNGVTIYDAGTNVSVVSFATSGQTVRYPAHVRTGTNGGHFGFSAEI